MADYTTIVGQLMEPDGVWPNGEHLTAHEEVLCGNCSAALTPTDLMPDNFKPRE